MKKPSVEREEEEKISRKGMKKPRVEREEEKKKKERMEKKRRRRQHEDGTAGRLPRKDPIMMGMCLTDLNMLDTLVQNSVTC